MYRGNMTHETEEKCKSWRKTDLLFQKWQVFGEFWPERSKVYKVWATNVQRNNGTEDLCHGNEEWCKIWRGIELLFKNWHDEFDAF